MSWKLCQIPIIFVWKIPFSHLNSNKSHVYQNFVEIAVQKCNDYIFVCIICAWSCLFVAMGEPLDNTDVLQHISSEHVPLKDKKVTNNKLMKAKNNCVLPEEKSLFISRQSQNNSTKLTFETEQNNVRTGKSATKLQRRDSFSSCSSDSAVYCSSRSVQGDNVAQNNLKKPTTRQNNVSGKKRLRNSSGSSDASSASDVSNKQMPSSNVSLINFHLRGNCSKDSFPELCEKIAVSSEIKSQSSMSCTKTTITKSETFVEKKTCSSFKETKDEMNSQQHNLRRQIRKKTCSCDCGTSSLTYILRRVEVQKTRNCHTLSQMVPCSGNSSGQRQPNGKKTSPNSSQCVKVSSCLKPFTPVPQSPIFNRESLCRTRSAETKTEPCSPKTDFVNEQLSSNETSEIAEDHEDFRNISDLNEQASRLNRKRRSEMDKLYDALHEIKWAKHMSPDNILSQIDVRRAASASSYSNAGKAFNSSRPEPNISKSLSNVKPASLKHLMSRKLLHSSRMATRNSSRTTQFFSSSKNRLFKRDGISKIQHNTTLSTRRTRSTTLVEPSPSVVKRVKRVLSKSTSLNQNRDNTNLLDRHLLNVDSEVPVCNGSVKKPVSTEQGLCCDSKMASDEIETNLCDTSEKIDLCCSNVNSSHLECNEGDTVGETNSSDQSKETSSTSEHIDSFSSDVIKLDNDVPETLDEVSTIELHGCEEFASYVSNMKGEETILIIQNPDLLGVEELQNIKQLVQFADSQQDISFGMLNHCVREEEVTTAEESVEDVSADHTTLPVLTVISPTSECFPEDTPPVLVPYIDPTNVNYGYSNESSSQVQISDVEITSNNQEAESLHMEMKSLSSSTQDLCISDGSRNVENKSLAERTSLLSQCPYPLSIRSLNDYKAIFESEQHSIKKRIFKKYFNIARKRLKKSRRLSQTAVRLQTSKQLESRNCREDLNQSNSHEKFNPYKIMSRMQSNLNLEDEVVGGVNSILRKKNWEFDLNCFRHENSPYQNPLNKFYRAFSSNRHTTCSSVDKNLISHARACYSSYEELVNDRRYGPMMSSYGSSPSTEVVSTKPTLGPFDAIMPSPSDFSIGLKMSCKFSMHYKGITVNKNDSYTQVTLKETRGKSVYLSVDVLIELKEIFLNAIEDDDCQVLILNGVGSSFCSGLDLKPLIGPKRKTVATEMAVALKNFIEAVSSFNKPLVSVVNGAAVGLGVTLLAYSDVIIASDASSYHMLNNQLGYPPEAGAVLMLPFAVGSTVAMDLLLRGRKISAKEALECGLVTQVLSAKNLPLELVRTVRVLSENLNSAREITKSMLRVHLLQRLGFALEYETEELPKYWLSEEGQTALQDAFQSGLLD